MCLERLAHEAIEADHAGCGVVLKGWIEPRQNAAPAFGRDSHDRVGLDAELLHQRTVEPDRQPRAVAELVGEMIDAGVPVGAAAVRAAGAMLIRTLVHCFFSSFRFAIRSFPRKREPRASCAGLSS